MRWLFGEDLISILSNLMHAKHFQCRNKMKQLSTHFLHILRIPVILAKSKDLKLAKCSFRHPMASHGIRPKRSESRPFRFFFLAQNPSFEMPTMMSLDGRGSAEVCASPQFLFTS